MSEFTEMLGRGQVRSSIGPGGTVHDWVRMPPEAAGSIAVPTGPYFAENLLAITAAQAEGFRARRRARRRAPISLALRRLWWFLLGWGTPRRQRRWQPPPIGLSFRVLEQDFDAEGNRVIGKVRLDSARLDRAVVDYDEVKRRWEEQFAPPAATHTQEDHDG